jgi:hypothetical protein
MITHLPKPFDTPCVFQVVRVSGTIRKSEEEAIRRAREQLRRARSGGHGTAEGLDVIMGGIEGDDGVIGHIDNEDEDHHDSSD